jgi:hypothetical protein
MKLYITLAAIILSIIIPAIVSAASAAETISNNREKQMTEIQQLFGE